MKLDPKPSSWSTSRTPDPRSYITRHRKVRAESLLAELSGRSEA